MCEDRSSQWCLLFVGQTCSCYATDEAIDDFIGLQSVGTLNKVAFKVSMKPCSIGAEPSCFNYQTIYLISCNKLRMTCTRRRDVQTSNLQIIGGVLCPAKPTAFVHNSRMIMSRPVSVNQHLNRVMVSSYQGCRLQTLPECAPELILICREFGFLAHDQLTLA
jgi:hypothetical protein